MEICMAKFPSFLEYLNDKGSLVEKPEVETVPDYHGPEEKTPPGSKVPYKTPVANKSPEKGEKGLSELGDEKLKYEPNTKLNYETKKDALKEYVNEKGKVLEKGREDIKGDYKYKNPKSPEGSDYPYVADDQKIKVGEKGLGELGEKEFEYNPDTKNAKKVTKTENFLNKTKGMSLSEFTSYMLKECGCGQVNDDSLPFITAYTTGKFQPHPPEVIRYISVLADKNNGILENLVSQMISMGYLNKLLKTIFEHPQAYEELTNLFNDEKDGPTRCDSFVGSMKNSYSKFLSDQDGLYESVSSPYGFDMDMKDKKEDMDMEDEEDMDMEDEEDMDMEDEEDMDMEDEEDMDMEDEEDMDMEDEEDMDMEDEEDMDMEDKEFGPKEEPRRLKKKFAHDNLLSSMKKHDFMMKAMRGE
jgi:hypothetical protein